MPCFNSASPICPDHRVARSLTSAALLVTSLLGGTTAMADIGGPAMDQGIQIGDLAPGKAVIWSRADRPARMMVEYAYNADFSGSTIVRGPHALDITDYTARQDLVGLQDGKDVFVKVWFEDLGNARTKSDPVTGRFHTIGKRDDIRFIWGGDTAGQGWGINPDFGGMRIYEAMRQRTPAFFIHSGDNVYSDGVILPEVKDASGNVIWKNIVTPEVSKVSETLDEFRGRYKYNLLDDNIRRFNAEVPQIWQWDDHEVVNNWSDSKVLDGRYTIVKDVPLLVAHASEAFHEFAPMRPFTAEESERVYRKIAYGSLLEVFVLDMRNYRGPNTANLQTMAGPETAFLGAAQVEWLEQGLKNSKAKWKVIAADMPIGLNVGDGTDAQGNARWEAIANGENGVAKGRELEIAGLLSFIKHEDIKNTVWLTADVHYTAAHYYDPKQAVSKDFAPFWEFVAGPLNAGTFGPNTTDGTFGPQVVFVKAPPAGQANLPPTAGLQFFGEVNIDRDDETLTVDLKDINGTSVFSKRLIAD